MNTVSAAEEKVTEAERVIKVEEEEGGNMVVTEQEVPNKASQELLHEVAQEVPEATPQTFVDCFRQYLSHRGGMWLNIFILLSVKVISSRMISFQFIIKTYFIQLYKEKVSAQIESCRIYYNLI
jgi:hypothetical protein